MKIERERLDRRWAENGPDTVEEKSQYSFMLSRAIGTLFISPFKHFNMDGNVIFL